MEEIDDVLACFELHQCRAVVLAEFRQGRPHVTEDRTVVIVGVESGRALAKHLFVGEQLLVNLEADLQSDLGVIQIMRQGDSPRSEPADHSNE